MDLDPRLTENHIETRSWRSACTKLDRIRSSLTLANTSQHGERTSLGLNSFARSSLPAGGAEFLAQRESDAYLLYSLKQNRKWS